jgi:hypothetical protein
MNPKAIPMRGSNLWANKAVLWIRIGIDFDRKNDAQKKQKSEKCIVLK